MNPAGSNPSQVAEAVRVLRQELDGRGLRDVQIIAPEWASADRFGPALHRRHQGGPGSLGSLARHCHAQLQHGGHARFPEIIAGTGKQYWMTEAADNGNENEADANLAASISARFLNDLNHGVTHWLYFIGFHDSSDVTQDNDNATKLMVYDLKRQRIFRHLKYDWFRQLRAAFPNGSRIYPLKAQPGGDLVYSFGQKPFLNAAAARRPDGGWSLGMVNLSGLGPNTSISQWQPPTTLKVTWQAAPLASQGSVALKVFRSDTTQRFISADRVTMAEGTLSMVLKPRELVTLTSD